MFTPRENLLRLSWSLCHVCCSAFPCLLHFPVSTCLSWSRQWAWFLRLIGEDEGSIETHQKAVRKSRDENDGSNHATHERPSPSAKNESQSRAGRNGGQEDERADPSSSKWSWVGHRSPLMDTREEAELILDRLQRKLRGELQSVVREQQGEDGFERVRSEEGSNEERPLEVSPMQ